MSWAGLLSRNPGVQALGFFLQLCMEMGELDFQGFLLEVEEGCTFVVWRLGWREPQFRRPRGGRLGKQSGWRAFVEATWGRDRVEVTSTEHLLCFPCPRLCAYNILAHDHLEGKFQKGKTRMFSLPRNPHPWEQSQVPSGPSATTCWMHVKFTEALQGLCYHYHLQMRKLMLWEVESFSQVSQWMRAKVWARFEPRSLKLRRPCPVWRAAGPTLMQYCSVKLPDFVLGLYPCFPGAFPLLSWCFPLVAQIKTPRYALIYSSSKKLISLIRPLPSEVCSSWQWVTIDSFQPNDVLTGLCSQITEVNIFTLKHMI